MILHQLTDRTEARLEAALERFASMFTYPLGAAARFSVSHGEDHIRFFRAIGRACCVVAELDGEVVGTLSGAVRILRTPDGPRRVLYLGDLKIQVMARGGTTLLRLARTMQAWAGPQVNAGYAVVMDGTAVTPERYTGRLGIPVFTVVGRLAILRIPSAPGAVSWAVEQASGTYQALTAGYLAGDGSEAGARLRSRMPPQWLCAPDGGACGRIEDTCLAKRLLTDGGTELSSAHLSAFAWRDADSAAGLLRQAAAVAHAQGLPALFVAVMAGQAPALMEKFGAAGITVAPATIYAHGIAASPWIIDTAEI
ncbi:hypothetical protein LBMAG53_13700 [Planctomycetota bacterium]|nr:hypothetical protein LBMAG53_13700 [Planctomycetota bacterium]